MRAICGSIVAAGGLIGIGLAVVGFGIRFQHAGIDNNPATKAVWGSASMSIGLWVLIAGFLVGLGIAFVGLVYHHERRHRERLQYNSMATASRSPSP